MAYISTDDPQATKKIHLSSVPFGAVLRRNPQPAFGTGTPSTIGVELQRIDARKRDSCAHTQEILRALHQLLNYEIVERGDSYPFPNALTLDQFVAYYAGYELFVLVLKSADGVTDSAQFPLNIAKSDDGKTEYDFGRIVVGSFYVKPNYPFRSAHVCNGGFLVVPRYQRGFGAGTLMGRRYVLAAVELGYHASMFNLVYSTNIGSIKLWQRLGFTHLSTIPLGGRVKVREPKGDGKSFVVVEKFVDVYQFHADLRALAKKIAPELTLVAASKM